MADLERSVRCLFGLESLQRVFSSDRVRRRQAYHPWPLLQSKQVAGHLDAHRRETFGLDAVEREPEVVDNSDAPAADPGNPTEGADFEVVAAWAQVGLA